MSVENLAKFLKYHFVRGTRIFTDGKQAWQDYETLRIDESSTPYSKYYSTLNIRPSPDKIEILDSNGDPYITINENGNRTNILIATDTDKKGSSDTDNITTTVIHTMDGVLIKQ